ARVRELESRMDAVQPGAAPSAAPVTPAAPGTPASGAADERIASLENEVAEMTAANAARHDDIGLPLHGFADVGAGTRSPNNPDLHGADVGSLDFYLTPELGEHAVALRAQLQDEHHRRTGHRPGANTARLST